MKMLERARRNNIVNGRWLVHLLVRVSTLVSRTLFKCIAWLKNSNVTFPSVCFFLTAKWKRLTAAGAMHAFRLRMNERTLSYPPCCCDFTNSWNYAERAGGCIVPADPSNVFTSPRTLLTVANDSLLKWCSESLDPTALTEDDHLLPLVLRISKITKEEYWRSACVKFWLCFSARTKFVLRVRQIR